MDGIDTQLLDAIARFAELANQSYEYVAIKNVCDSSDTVDMFASGYSAPHLFLASFLTLTGSAIVVSPYAPSGNRALLSEARNGNESAIDELRRNHDLSVMLNDSLACLVRKTLEQKSVSGCCYARQDLVKRMMYISVPGAKLLDSLVECLHACTAMIPVYIMCENRYIIGSGLFDYSGENASRIASRLDQYDIEDINPLNQYDHPVESFRLASNIIIKNLFALYVAAMEPFVSWKLDYDDENFYQQRAISIDGMRTSFASFCSKNNETTKIIYNTLTTNALSTNKQFADAASLLYSIVFENKARLDKNALKKMLLAVRNLDNKKK